MGFLKKLRLHKNKTATAVVSCEKHVKSEKQIQTPVNTEDCNYAPVQCQSANPTVEQIWKTVLQRDDHIEDQAKWQNFNQTTICGACGLINDSRTGHGVWYPEDDEKWRYTYVAHGKSSGERMRRRLQLEQLIMDETVQLEVLLQNYLNGELGHFNHY